VISVQVKTKKTEQRWATSQTKKSIVRNIKFNDFNTGKKRFEDEAKKIE